MGGHLRLPMQTEQGETLCTETCTCLAVPEVTPGELAEHWGHPHASTQGASALSFPDGVDL